MKNPMIVKLAVPVGVLMLIAVGLAVLATPVAADCQHPVACPAIAKLCKSGEIACRVSPCNCAQVCVPEGVGCNI